MNAARPSKTLHPAVSRGRFSPAGGLTSGGRLTLLVIVTGLVVLGQAWLVAHRYGQHAAARAPSHVQTHEPQIPHASSQQ